MSLCMYLLLHAQASRALPCASGFKAAGDAAALRELGAKYGMDVAIVDLVQDEAASGDANGRNGDAKRHSGEAPAGIGGCSNPEQISSSKVRGLLAEGKLRDVSRLLGRCYRLVASLDYGGPRRELRWGERGDSASRGGAHTAVAGGGKDPSGSSAAVEGLGFSLYGGGSGVGGSGVAVLPTATFLNVLPADGGYEASLSVVYRGTASGFGLGGSFTETPGTAEGTAAPALLQTLPLELESGSGLPLRVRVDNEGLHLSRDALDAAVAAALPASTSPAAAGGASAIYIVVDIWS